MQRLPVHSAEVYKLINLSVYQIRKQFQNHFRFHHHKPDKLCNGECFNPTDERNNISRIEIIRIRPQTYSDEPIETLIEDTWKIFECEPSQEGCIVEFEDPNFIDANREVIYYVRAIQEPSLAIGAANLACEFDDGKCKKVKLCGDAKGQGEGDCLSENEERAWSSPIFIKYSQS